ncbi:hypothetical protein NQZ68_033757 [Dissostichus eleginoides]|nr:hypothetical protein NQZ68_033757 [Dissostichus eleginoides]
MGEHPESPLAWPVQGSDGPPLEPASGTMLVQGSLPPSKKEKSCIIKMGGEGSMDGGQEQRDGGKCLCLRSGAERSPVTHGFGLEEQNRDPDKHIEAASGNLYSLGKV